MIVSLPGYDAWLQRGNPADMPDIPLPGDPGYPCCSLCGAFLRRAPDQTAPFTAFGVVVPARDRITWEIWEVRCDGIPQDGYETDCDTPSATVHPAHTYVAHAAQLTHRTCKRCGHRNIEVDA